MGWAYPAYNYFGKTCLAGDPGYPVYLYKNRDHSPAIDEQTMYGWDSYRARASTRRSTFCPT